MSTRTDKTLLIRNIIIKKDNVRELADTFYSICRDLKKKKKHIEYILVCEKTEDEVTRFSCTSPAELFNADSPINSKRILSITMQFYGDPDTEIQIKLTHKPTADGDNKIVVNGADAWVTNTKGKLMNIVSTFEPQNRFVQKYILFLYFIFALSIGSILLFLVTWFASNFPASEFSQNIVTLQQSPFIKYASLVTIGLIPAYYLTGKVKELWPKVEFQLGPEHTHIEKTKRKWATNLLVVGVIPLLIQLSYDIVKGVFASH